LGESKEKLISHIIDEFKEYFGKFGKVEDFERINDVVTGEFKGDSFDFRRD